MKSKKQHKPAELVRIKGGFEGSEARNLFINGKTDKVPYMECYNATLENDFWECADTFHKTKTFISFLKLDGTEIPDRIHATFEVKFIFPYADISHITVVRDGKRIKITFQMTLSVRKMSVNPFLFFDYLKKHLTEVEYGDDSPEWIIININYPCTGKMQYKMESGIIRITQAIEDAEKHLLRRIKKLYALINKTSP